MFNLGLKSVRTQLMIVAVLAVVSVIVTGRVIEKINAFQHSDIVDVDLVGQRAVTLAYLLDGANDTERRYILGRSAEVGISIEIATRGDIAKLPKPEEVRGQIGALLAYFFPPDNALPNGASVRIVDNRPVLTMPINGQEVLIYRSFPNSIFSQDFAGAMLYYVLSIIILSVLFSVFAVRYLAGPLTYISSQIDDTDVFLSQQVPLKEAGGLEIARLARALNDMRARIQFMLRSRTEMLRSVSHDLRTPLTRLRMRTERISNEPLREQVQNDIQQLNVMIDTTLDYLRDDHTAEAVERTDLASIMQTICDDFSDVGALISYSGPTRCVYHCKPIALTRAVTNLCDNGLKFGDEVRIILFQTEGSIVIEVRDNGPGIPPQFRKSVLEPFYQIDQARTRKAGIPGFGLGLSIVDAIVREHGGHMEFDDNVPRGLTVRLAFPADGSH